MNKDFFLITDTLPYELPLIYSNKNLQDYLQDHDTKKIKVEDITHLTQSVPLHYFIMKNSGSKRLMSLVHPLAQIQMNAFKDIFSQELIEYCNNHAIYSIRYPSGINSSKISIKEIEQDITFIIDETHEYHNNEFEDYIDSYYEKKRFKTLPDFYKSNQFKKLEIKYNTLLKMDIKSCFDNIYTHSFDWAYLGSKELAKEIKDKKERFSYILDKLMQVINYNESKGIVVGPEFSRCVVEIILMRVDQCVYYDLISQNKINKVDYEIIRYMDDIFIFSNNTELSNNIRLLYEKYYKQYKLDINDSKVYIESRPFLRKNSWNPDLKRAINFYFNDIFMELDLDEKNQWFSRKIEKINNQLIGDIRKIIGGFEREKDKIVSFVLKSFDNRWKQVFEKIDILDHRQKTLFLCMVIDSLQYTLTFSPNYDNILRFVKIITKIHTYSLKESLGEVNNILYKNCYELLKYNLEYHMEFLNLIIFLRRLDKDIPENILLSFIDKDNGYLTLGTIAFYISTKNRKYRFKSVRRRINEYINNISLEIKEGICDVELPNPSSVEKIIYGKDFYCLHDFYSSEILYKSTKMLIQAIKDWINKVNLPLNNKINNLFWGYAKDFDKPFLQLSYSDDDIIEKIIYKTNKVSPYN